MPHGHGDSVSAPTGTNWQPALITRAGAEHRGEAPGEEQRDIQSQQQLLATGNLKRGAWRPAGEPALLPRATPALHKRAPQPSLLLASGAAAAPVLPHNPAGRGPTGLTTADAKAEAILRSPQRPAGCCPSSRTAPHSAAPDSPHCRLFTAS